jgi:cbb3-type cytochrome oxidase cytochrome c subunit
VQGYEDVNKIGPDLAGIGGKVAPSWLFRWVKNPKWHHEKSRMPDFKLSDDEATSVTAFLMSLKGNRSWKTHQVDEESLNDQDLIARGEDLVEEIGCTGCHSIGHIVVYKNSARDMGPILTNIGKKTTPHWTLNWVLDPTSYTPQTLMPDFRLSLAEAQAIVAYLYSLRGPELEGHEGLEEKLTDQNEIQQGLKVVANYGCHGCHNIPGTEEMGRVGAELTNFGNKQLYEIAFAQAKDVERSWLGFTKAKLKTPRLFETEIVVQKMPDFRLSDEEIHALAILLKSFRDESIPKDFTKEISPEYTDVQMGRKLIKKYSCTGCHEIEQGWGGENILVSLTEKYNDIEAKGYSPPPLMGEGRKVQSEWLFRFIHDPATIRPWLSIRMPTFNLTNRQVNSMVKYFQSVSNVEVFYHFWKKGDYTAEEEKEMKYLFDALQCLKCHEGKKGETEIAVTELAPDLSLTKHRLKAKWVNDWMTDPQGVEPGTKMPNFFFDIDEDGEVTEMLPEPQKKMQLLVDYLYSME